MSESNAFDTAQVVAELQQVTEHLAAIAANPEVSCFQGHVFEWTSPTYPVGWLRERLGLSVTEERILWTLLAFELSPDARRSFRELATDGVTEPTIDAIRRAVYGGSPNAKAWRELGEGGALWRFGLIERASRRQDEPVHRQIVRIASRVIALAHGEIALDSELEGIAAIDERPFAIEAIEVAPGVTTAGAAALSSEELVIVRGGAGTGRRSLLVALAQVRGMRVLVVDGAAISSERDRARRQLRIVGRECALFGLVPLIRGIDALGASGEISDRMDLVESELSGRVLATTTRLIARRWKRAPVLVESPPLGGAQRARLWKRALPCATEGDADVLATLYPLAPALIEAAARVALRQCGGASMQPEHIQVGIRSVLDDRLAGLATRFTVTQSWDDVVLPEDQTTALVELLARIRERRCVYEEWGFAQKVGKGLGVTALFSGPPGTGKTMCAGLVARDLGTELYQVDLSKIVSKWIGETEKNLAALFDAAEAGHAILLFDEADALFGKRTDVKSSNDRHANQETNYLLQRLETFAGICILTTNHETAIDEAFRRRLAVHVRFPVPEAEERVKLWEALIPPTAPVAPDLGLDRLGEAFVMSGGYIRNAVLRAAFLAADRGSPIDAALLARAAQLEYEAMGKVVARR